MSFVRMASFGLSLTTAVLLLAGCGEQGGSAAVDEQKPTAGLEASKKIQEMGPPPLVGGSNKKAGRR